MKQPITTSTTKHSKLSQAGIASIMVTLIMMIVISLIVLGFAEIARREQRNSLDRQLSTEAFYAAESGVNDAESALNINPSLVKTTCPPFAGNGPLGTNPRNTSIIDSTANISYSCLLINPTPPSLIFNSIGVGTSEVVPLQPASGNFNNITISWQQSGSSTTNFACPATGSFPPSGSWGCDPGMLRIDLVSGASLDRASLLANDFVAFLQPRNGGGPGGTSYNPSATGTVVAGGCSTVVTPTTMPYYCNVTISGLTASLYYLRISPIYKDASVNISGVGPVGPVQFVGAQAVIDSTGKAQDELRRIQVREPLSSISSSSSNIPNFAIQTEYSICKKFAVAPGFGSNQSAVSECASGPTAPF